MKIYTISNITSVNMGACSVLIAISNMEAYAQFLQAGLYAGITGILLFLISRKTKYSAHIKSATGELRILEANDRDHVERIVIAIHEAILLRDKLQEAILYD